MEHVFWSLTSVDQVVNAIIMFQTFISYIKDKRLEEGNFTLIIVLDIYRQECACYKWSSVVMWRGSRMQKKRFLKKESIKM